MVSRRSFLAAIAGLFLNPVIPQAKGRNRIFGGKNYIGIPSSHYDIYKCKVSVNLGREELYELGRKMPFHRYTNYPVKITEEIIK